MADIFLSYTEKDRDTVRRLAETLQRLGWSVWWDRRIPAGLTWRSVLEQELQSMRCMLVLWSSNSVQSEWVCEEAAEGRQLSRLVPVLIDRVRPPAGFRELQAADLVDWDGSRDFAGLKRLIEDIERLIGKPVVARQEVSMPDPATEATDTTAPNVQSDAGDGDNRHRESNNPTDSRWSGPVSSVRRLVPWGAAALVVVVAASAYFVQPPTAIPPPRSATPPLPAASAIAPQESMASSTAAMAKPLEAAAVKEANTPQRAAVKTVPAPSTVGARCTALVERIALGEPLSSESQLFLHKECRK